MTADLHLHTHYSDGNWTPQDLVDQAVKLGFKCMAITDHDTVAALPESRLHAADRIRLIDGIELNTIWKNPDGEFQDVHILGYFIDPESQALQEAIARQQTARIDYVMEILSRLKSQGHNIGFEEVRAAAGKGSIGRPHICIAMLKAGIANDIQQAFRMLLNRDSDLKTTRHSISPQDAIKAIAAAGGLSSLAHPGKDSHIQLQIEEFANCGLNAIEAYHRAHTNSQLRKYSKIAKARNLLVTGGSDCHGPFEAYPPVIGSVKLPDELVRRLDEAHAITQRNPLPL